MSTAKKILICDDDDTLRESLCEQFALHEEFSVFEAPTATDAMKLSKSEHCDLVLLDIKIFGLVAALGGTLLIIGWATAAFGFLTSQKLEK